MADSLLLFVVVLKGLVEVSKEAAVGFCFGLLKFWTMFIANDAGLLISALVMCACVVC